MIPPGVAALELGREPAEQSAGGAEEQLGGEPKEQLAGGAEKQLGLEPKEESAGEAKEESAGEVMEELDGEVKEESAGEAEEQSAGEAMKQSDGLTMNQLASVLDEVAALMDGGMGTRVAGEEAAGGDAEQAFEMNMELLSKESDPQPLTRLRWFEKPGLDSEDKSDRHRGGEAYEADEQLVVDNNSSVSAALKTDRSDDKLIFHSEVVAALSEGSFGRVLKMYDVDRRNCVALKIIKKKFHGAAEFEVHILKQIIQWDPNGKNLCVKMIDWFDYDGHMCISFEMLGMSVHEFMLGNKNDPYELVQIRQILYQLCRAVKFLHDLDLTHTDLKLENILFVNSDYTMRRHHLSHRWVRHVNQTDLRLIDFGSVTYDWEHHSETVSTRNYRAPEVVLSLGWSHPCDVWSIGCMLIEMYLGIKIFKASNDREHLGLMERLLGQIPCTMSCTEDAHHEKLDWHREGSLEGRYVRDYGKSLYLFKLKDCEDDDFFFDLLEKMLTYEPSLRVKCADALTHPFFDKLNAAPGNKRRKRNKKKKSPKPNN